MTERYSNGLLEYIPGSRPVLFQSTNGQPLEGFVQNIRDSIREYAESGQNEIEKGTNFLQWVLTRVFEATEDDATNAIVDGPNDLGIDAYLPVDFSEDRIYLFQSKYGTSHSMEAVAKFKEDVRNLQNRDITKMRPELAHLVTQIREKNLKVECVYVTDQKVEYQSQDSLEVYDIDTIVFRLWDRIKKPAAGKKATIRLESKLRYQNTLLGILKLRELTNFVTKNKDYVFESNIRQWMQFKTTVNKGIRETLQESPHKFFYYNNGITIVVSDFEELEDNALLLHAPQIVNGAQTSNSILDHAKRTHNLEGSITVTIIKAADEQDQNNITKYRNSQNAVRGKDLVSLMDFHKSIKSQMENGYFYEIQAGSFDSKAKSQQSEFKGDPLYNKYLPDNHKKVIVAKDAIQALVAGIEQRPTESYSSPAQFLPRGSKYDEVFNEKLKDDYRLLLYPYLVKEYAKKVLNYGKKGGHKTKRYATLFFVAVYFKILHERILLTKGDFKEDISKLEPIFKSIKLNQRILKITDTIVTKFLEDTVVDDEMVVANTYHNFFSHHVWQDSMVRVIEKKIKQEEEEISSIKKIVQDLF